MKFPHEAAAIHIVEVIKEITANQYPDEVVGIEDIHRLLSQYNKDVEHGFNNGVKAFTAIFKPTAS